MKEDLKELAGQFIKHIEKNNIEKSLDILHKIPDDCLEKWMLIGTFGLKNFQNEEYNNAVKYLNQALDLCKDLNLEPDQIIFLSTIQFHLGIIYSQLGHVDKALDKFKHSLQLNPNNAETYFRIGISLCEKEDFFNASEATNIEAKKYLKKFIELYPDSYQGNYYLVQINYFLKKYDEVVFYAEKAIKLGTDNQNILTYLYLGFAYHYFNEYDKAITSFKKVVKLFPEMPTIFLNIGKCFFELDNYKEALKYFKIAHKKKSTDPEYLYMVGLTLFMQNKWDKAIEYLIQSNDLDDQNRDILNGLGAAYYMINKYDKSFYYLCKALELDPTDTTYYYLGIVCRAINKYKESVKYLTRALVLKPNDGRIIAELSISYFFNKNDKKAMTFANEALKFDLDKEITIRLSMLLQFLNQNDKSIAIIDDLLSKDPKNSILYILKGKGLLNKFDFNSAIDCYIKSSKYDSKEVELNFVIGKIFLAQKNYFSAVDYFEKAIDLLIKKNLNTKGKHIDGFDCLYSTIPVVSEYLNEARKRLDNKSKKQIYWQIIVTIIISVISIIISLSSVNIHKEQFLKNIYSINIFKNLNSSFVNNIRSHK